MGRAQNTDHKVAVKHFFSPGNRLCIFVLLYRRDETACLCWNSPSGKCFLKFVTDSLRKWNKCFFTGWSDKSPSENNPVEQTTLIRRQLVWESSVFIVFNFISIVNQNDFYQMNKNLNFAQLLWSVGWKHSNNNLHESFHQQFFLVIRIF